MRRLVSTLLVLVSGVFVLGIVLLIPSFVAVVSLRDTGAARLATARGLLDRQKDATAIADVDSVNEKMGFVTKSGGAVLASDTIARVVGLVPERVALQSVLWRSEGESIFLDLTGSAATRSALIAFGDALRSSGIFTDVTIPIESLAPQTDLRFRLSLTLAP